MDAVSSPAAADSRPRVDRDHDDHGRKQDLVETELPVPISQIGGRYLIFDVDVASFLRREYRVCGTTIGTLPLAPSQNLFLGVPVEIMPEEAQLLVERGVAHLVDDARAHDQAAQALDMARRSDYMARLQRQSAQLEQLRIKGKEQSRRKALEKKSRNVVVGESKAKTKAMPRTQSWPTLLDGDDDPPSDIMQEEADEEDSTAGPFHSQLPSNTLTPQNYQITPATSRYLLSTSPATPTPEITSLPPSYPLYRHLHDRGFFMTPGLRFGCQYTVYPGDPLRFHSHFLAVGAQWEQEIDLMDIVGGGRLGTGVKKGFLLGGHSPTTGNVRTFSVEWAAM